MYSMTSTHRSETSSTDIPGIGLLPLGILCAISALIAITAGSSWYARFGPGARSTAGAIAFLEDVQSKERAVFAATQAYAPTFESIGVTAPESSDGWTYRLLATRIDGRSLLLVEADSGDRHLAIDGFGRLYQSDIAPLPGI